MPMVLPAAGEHVARLETQSGEQRGGAVTDVVVGDTLDVPDYERQRRLSTIEGPDLALFVRGHNARVIPPVQRRDRAARARRWGRASGCWHCTPGSPRPRGRSAIASGDVLLARTAFERAVVAAPGFYEAWLGVADTRARLGDTAGADLALAHAESLPGSSDGRVQTLRAHIHAR